MAIQLKPIESIATKWSQRANAAAPEYKAGVAAPKVDWAQAAAGAENNYQQGVNEAIGRQGFSKGVRAAGSAKWQNKAGSLGAQRFTTGVQAATQDYNTGFAPFYSALGQVSLPAKGPRGAASNLQRVQAIADAMRAKKLAGGA